MTTVLYFAILGLGAGGVYALLSSGLIAAHRGSGVINFAHGAIATFAMYAFSGLRKDGVLRLPVFDFLPTHDVNVPQTVRLSSGPMALLPAAATAILMGVLIALAAFVLVFRPLRNAAPLAKVVGAVGILIYLQAIVVLQYGTQPRSPEDVLPSGSLENFLWTGRSIGIDRLLLCAIALAVAIALHVFYRQTRTGLIVRALAEDEAAGAVLGLSQQRFAALSWAIAGVLAGLVGVLGAPLVGVDPTRYTLLLVPALSAALIARFSAPMVATLVAFALGAFESLVTYLSSFDWFPQGLQRGITTVVPLVLVLIALYLRSDAIPQRGVMREKPLPRVPKPRHTAPFVAIALVLGLFAAARFTGPWAVSLTTSVIGVILMLSLVVLVGYLGQLSLAQLAIAGVAAFGLMRLMSNGVSATPGGIAVSGPGLPFVISAPLSILIGTAVGVGVGLPAIRIRGVQLAVATIALALTVQNFVLQSSTLVGQGAGQVSPVPRPTIGSLDLSALDEESGLTDRFAFAALALVIAAALMLAIARLRTTTAGRQLLAIRANERAAAGAGINVVRVKLVTIVGSSAIAGIAGVLMAMQQGSVSASQFDFTISLLILAFVYIGGIGSVWGAVLGGLMMGGGLLEYLIKSHIPGYVSYSAVIGGALMALSAVLNPAGVTSSFRMTAGTITERIRARRHGPPTIVIGEPAPPLGPGNVVAANCLTPRARAN